MEKLVCLCVLVLCAIQLTSADFCVSCDSRTDINCVTNPDGITPTNCSSPTLNCYTRIITGGFTIRGCLSDLDTDVVLNCVSETGCLTCNTTALGMGCNNQIFPEHRLFCHQCTGDVNASSCSLPQPENGFPCILHAEGDRCFTRRTDDRVTRGCMSAREENTICANVEHCAICEGHGCNRNDSNLAPLDPSAASFQMASVLFSVCAFLVVQFMNKARQ